VKAGVPYAHTQRFFKHDGGRSNYFQGTAGDCVTRAIAIATGINYKVVYDAMFNGILDFKENGRGRYVRNLRKRKAGSKGTTPRNGVHIKIYKKYLESLGWIWVPTMTIGSGCKVHLRGDELPSGRIIVRVSKHLATLIDGVLYDTYDCTRAGSRCVYGYFYHPSPQIVSIESDSVAMHDVKKMIEKKRPHFNVKLSNWYKEEMVRMIDTRLDTIQDDPSSADSFETVNTLTLLRYKIEGAGEREPVFTDEERKWLQEELSNAESIGILKADKLIDYINAH
jgi:hypothetical protein